jgi:hypothetical protein
VSKPGYQTKEISLEQDLREPTVEITSCTGAKPCIELDIVLFPDKLQP